MSYTIARRFVAAAALMAAGSLFMSRTAQAAPTLQIAVGNGAAQNYALTYDATTQTYNFSTGSGNYTVGGLFQVSVSVTSQSSPTFAQLLDSTIDVRTNDQSNAARDIHITVFDGFTQPVGPSLTLTNSFTGSTSNGNDPQTFTGQILNQAMTTVIAGDTRILSSTTSPPIPFSNADPFTLRGVINLILNPNQSASVAGSVRIDGPAAVATPEPATMALACSGLGALGLAGLRRRLGRAKV